MSDDVAHEFLPPTMFQVDPMATPVEAQLLTKPCEDCQAPMPARRGRTGVQRRFCDACRGRRTLEQERRYASEHASFSCHVDHKMEKKVKLAASRAGKPVAAWVRSAIEFALKHGGKRVHGR